MSKKEPTLDELPLIAVARALGKRRQATMTKAESSEFHSRISRARWDKVRAAAKARRSKD